MKIKNGELTYKKKKTKISEYSYSDQLKHLTLTKKVRTVSRLSFTGCRFLKKAHFNDGLIEIGYEAFYNCVSLDEAIIPSSVKVLSEGAFMDCRALKKVVLPPIRVLPKNLFKGCFSLEEVVIPDTVEIIEEGCFHSCIALKNITFSKNLTEIKANAFKRCQSLESVVFPKTLKILGNKAFEDDKLLKLVSFNGNLEYFGKAVFYNKVYDEHKVTGTAFCSSFTAKEELESCITITVPPTVENLALGFEGVLPFAYRNKNKTCPDHILEIAKEKVKVFMSSAYYSYNNDNDYIIKNGKFDFKKYDSQLEKAEPAEKPFVAAFRLSYPLELDEGLEKIYFDLINGYEKDVAFFSIEANDERVLTFLLENFNFDTEFCATLYSLCGKKGYSNLQEVVAQKKQKTALSETEALLNELLLV